MSSSLLQQRLAAKQIADLGGGAWLTAARLDEPLARITAALARYHEANPHTWGMTPAHVCDELGIAVKNFPKLAELLCSRGPVTLKYGHLALKTFKPAVGERLLKLREDILRQIQTAGVNGPARGNLMKELSIIEADMKVLTRLLIQDGTVMFLDGNFILRTVYDDCKQKLLALFTHAPVVDISAFRDAIGGNRKLAVAMLDAFDIEGLTKRVPEGRVLVKHGA